MERGIFQTMFTESDNVTHDLYRYLSLLTILVALGLEIYAVVLCNKVFDLQQFGIGMAALFAGMGIAMKLKQESKAVALTTPVPAIGQVP